MKMKLVDLELNDYANIWFFEVNEIVCLKRKRLLNVNLQECCFIFEW